jgi:hypothetical protein
MIRFSLRRIAIWFWIGAHAAFGQSLKFEVATVKPAARNNNASGVMPSTAPDESSFGI